MQYLILFLALCQTCFGQSARFFVKLTHEQYETTQGTRFGGTPNGRKLFPYESRFRAVCPNAEKFEWLVATEDLPRLRLTNFSMESVAVVTAPASMISPCGAAATRHIHEVLPQSFSTTLVNDPEAAGQTRFFNQINFSQSTRAQIGVTDLSLVFLDGFIDHHEDLPSNILSPVWGHGGAHGTPVAGVTAISGNGKGIVGIAQDVTIVSSPIFREIVFDGQKYTVTDEVSVMKALVQLYFAPYNMMVVNMSFALYESEADLYRWDIWGEVIGGLKDKVFFVAAAGNDAVDAERHQPCRAVSKNGGLCIAGVDEKDTLVKNSSFGKVVGLSAPWSMLTTVPNNKYAYVGGTSISSPIVAAATTEITKRVIAENPQIASGLRPNDLLRALRLGARFAPKIGGKISFPGILDFESSYQELKKIMSGTPSPELPVPTVYGARESWSGSENFRLGDFVSIFGDNLVEDGCTEVSTGVANLCSSAVYLNDTVLPIYFASPRQVNAKLPDSIFSGWQTTNTITIVRTMGGKPLAYTGKVVRQDFTPTY